MRVVDEGIGESLAIGVGTIAIDDRIEGEGRAVCRLQPLPVLTIGHLGQHDVLDDHVFQLILDLLLIRLTVVERRVVKHREGLLDAGCHLIQLHSLRDVGIVLNALYLHLDELGIAHHQIGHGDLAV